MPKYKVVMLKDNEPSRSERILEADDSRLAAVAIENGDGWRIATVTEVFPAPQPEVLDFEKVLASGIAVVTIEGGLVQNIDLPPVGIPMRGVQTWDFDDNTETSADPRSDDWDPEQHPTVRLNQDAQLFFLREETY